MIGITKHIRIYSLITSVALGLLFAVVALLPSPAWGIPNQSAQQLLVSGGHEGSDYTYANHVLTIKSSAALTITNSNPNISATDTILITSQDASVTLKDVNIDVSATSSACAFGLSKTDKAQVRLTLAGTNTLKSGLSRAGLEVPQNTSLFVTNTSTGTLNAFGGAYAAGIGGPGGRQGDNSAGSISIYAGTINAVPGSAAAAIGGGYRGSGGTITIVGGVITARAHTEDFGDTSAGIGKGVGGDSSGHFSTYGSFAGKGNPFIYTSSISDQSRRTSSTKPWSGVIIEGDTGSVYGSTTITLPARIASGVCLTIPDGVTLTVGSEFQNDGTIMLQGRAQVVGTVKGNPPFSLAGDLMIANGVSGKDYSYNPDTHILSITSDKPMVISGTTQTDTIEIQKEISAHLTLDNLSIDVSDKLQRTALELDTKTSLALTLKEGSANTLKSGDPNAGLQLYEGSSLVIDGTGTLSAIGGNNGAGIGSPSDGNGGSVVITSGVVVAQGRGGAGIGNGRGGSGSTFATGSSGSAVIFASSISDQSGLQPQTHQPWSGIIFQGSKGQVYGGVTLSSNVTIPAGATLVVPQGTTAAQLHIPTGITLTNDGIIENKGGIQNDGTLTGRGSIQNLPGDFSVIGGLLGTDYHFQSDGNPVLSITSNTPLTIANVHPETPTINTIEVATNINDANLTFSGVNIDVSGAAKPAVLVDGTSTLNLTLAPGSANTLVSGKDHAGLELGSGGGLWAAPSSFLSIDGSGSLNAQGGKYGAGIGTCFLSTYSAYITIKSGTVVASGGQGGAGIGGGYEGRVTKVSIQGGSVSAIGKGDAAGIGYGQDGNRADTFEMTGGTVNARSEGGSGIYFAEVTISGGTVYAQKGSGKEYGIYGKFSTGSPGSSVFITASSIGDQSQKESWSGVIFEGDRGKVYGNPTLTTPATIEQGLTLEVDAGHTLTLGDHMTLTNKGAISNSGSLKKTESATYLGSGSISSATSISISANQDPIAYGLPLTLSATVTKKANNEWVATSFTSSVNFIYNDGKNDHELGEATVQDNGDTGTATLTLLPEQLAAAGIPVGAADIFASFEGNPGLGDSAAGFKVHITKGTQAAPQVSGVAESVRGKGDGHIKGLSTAMEYATSDKGTYSRVQNKNMDFAPGTYWVRLAKTDTYNASEPTEVPIEEGPLPALSLSLSLEGWTYGDAANTPVLSGNIGGGDVTYTYKSTLAPDGDYSLGVPTDAGTYTVRARVAQTTWYNSGEATATFTIARAPPIPSFGKAGGRKCSWSGRWAYHRAYERHAICPRWI